MARNYRYSLDRHDAKIVGVCSTLGERFGIDPTILRVAWIAVPLLTPIDFTTAIVAYAVAGLYLVWQRKKAIDRRATRKSDFDRMGDIGTIRPSVHAMRTELDPTDRRLMAIDHHLSTPNDELAREIEALREEK
ncbi:MAG TPA: PspC domain-containing protein [Sphingomicrobium sp.]|nr:PspC domain-containing protein [Sphingomicrobium sp.]